MNIRNLPTCDFYQVPQGRLLVTNCAVCTISRQSCRPQPQSTRGEEKINVCVSYRQLRMVTDTRTMRILIVEDEPGITRYLQFGLVREGFSILTAASGRAAQE